MLEIKKSFLRSVKEYALITIGLLLYVLGWSIFLVPNNLVGGGVTGIASIIQYATGGAIKLGWTYLAFNAMLLILALKTLGPSFGGKTVYAIAFCSFGLNFFQGIIPAEFIKTMALDNGKLVCTLIGAVMTGVGIGMSMSQGGSTGGTDIIALVVNKYRGVSPGRMILWCDAVIIFSSLLVPSYTADGNLLPFADKFTTMIYGFILIAVVSTALDMYLSGSKQSVQLFILSKKYKEIADAITKDLHRGVTVLDGKGWYTQQPMEVLMVLTRKADLNLMLQYIRGIDPDVFMSVSSVTGVYGKGFDAIKVRRKS